MANTQQYFGLKELNSVVIRAYKNTQIGSKFYKEGEPILYFVTIKQRAIDIQNQNTK